MAEDTLLKGRVLEIQRMSTEDGPGIRTTVFMKGCPMRCLWCHNPESISPKPQIQWIGIRCIGCRTCVGTCPNGVLELSEEGMSIDREKCEGCGACAEECPSTALELIGKEWPETLLADEITKDAAYFAQSGGGVTISGGEATLQWNFVAALLEEIQQRGFHTAVDTCGIVKGEALDAILPFTNLVLFDIKEMDPEKHQEYTHAPLDHVLDTFRELITRREALEQPYEIWVRTPLIPGATARLENIEAIGLFLARVGNGAIARWDLLAFNNLCKDKYARLGQDWDYEGVSLLENGELEDLAAAARRTGVDPEIVHVSGATRMEESEAPLEPRPARVTALCSGC